MINWSYKTRGGSSPQGKPKVYLAYHPDDASFVDVIADEILAVANCAVFYRTEPIADATEHFELLADVSLFVIPVTTRFLIQSSEARSLELPFAEERHIPILPLMQESELDELFREKCGEIQYLDKTKRDATMISYEEKLKGFLESILIGDELAEKIRLAFDAYIFLSYRKKDRKYAQELMRLVHENDFCRDVAIWYDEYLTPGENFNDMIAAALHKSSLFALAVTPNLVNESNYVMNVEYPMAKEEQKTVLPIEFVPTDKTELANAYDGIADAIVHTDTDALQLALKDALHRVALRRCDDDPQHTFFIGLAYLSGIDVEKNVSRAIELITAAAEADLPEAIERLVAIYYNAEGVERDPEEALRWLKRLATVYQAHYEADKKEENAVCYLKTLFRLGTCLREEDELSEAFETFQQMLEASFDMEEAYEWPWLLQHQALCFTQLSDLTLMVEDYETAISFYEEAIELAEEMVEQEDSVENLHTLAVIYNNGAAGLYRNLMVSMIKEGDFSKEYYQKALKVMERIVSRSSAERYRRDLAVSYSNQGMLAATSEDYETAKHYYQKAIDLLETSADCQSVDIIADIAHAHIELGKVHALCGKMGAARQEYRQTLAILEPELAKKEHPTLHALHMRVYEGIGATYEQKGDLVNARYYFNKELVGLYPHASSLAIEDMRELLQSFLDEAEANKKSFGEQEYIPTRMYHLAFALVSRMIGQSDVMYDHHLYAEVCYQLCIYHGCFSDIALSTQYGEEARRVWMELSHLRPDIETFRQKIELVSLLLKKDYE